VKIAWSLFLVFTLFSIDLSLPIVTAHGYFFIIIALIDKMTYLSAKFQLSSTERTLL